MTDSSDPTGARPPDSDSVGPYEAEESPGPADLILEDLDEATGTYVIELELGLGDDDPDDDDPGTDVGRIDETVADGQVAYDCTSWAGESRGLLASLLNTAEIVHAWQGTTVTVREEDEERVDDLIDDVLASARPALLPSAAKVVYEVGTWPAALQTALADALTAADLPYEWDERGDLAVYAEHEVEVEAILETLPDPDDQELADDDGLAVHEFLDGLFIGSSRLVKKPADAAAIVQVVDATAALEQMSAPFGFEPPQWRTLVTRAMGLRDALEAEHGAEGSVDDDGLVAIAGTVRDLVRQYV